MEGQACLVDEAEEELLRTPYLGNAALGCVGHFLDRVPTAVGQVMSLQLRPEALDRVELRRIGGPTLHPQPKALGGEKGAHAPTPVAVEAAPQQRRAVAAELHADLLDHLDP